MTLFTTKALPNMQSCVGCHSVMQTGVAPFLTPGSEYTAITGYKMGAFVNVPASNQSLLLQKGQHTGPALTADQYTAVQAWLDSEIATRPSSAGGMMKSALLPTVPITTGDFNMNLGEIDPINDPLANVTFHLAPDSSNLYRISKLMMTAGPGSGISFKHPRLYFITADKSIADPSDALATAMQDVPAGTSATIGNGTVLLTNAPSNDPNTRFGIAFEELKKSQAMVVNVMCKAYAKFNTPVVTDLKACAMQCHSQGKNNSAYSAFDMGPTLGTDMTALMSFCTQTLGRVNKAMPAQSILLLQAIPVAQGGTANHPYKYTVQTDITRFTTEVTTWVMAEQ